MPDDNAQAYDASALIGSRKKLPSLLLRSFAGLAGGVAVAAVAGHFLDVRASDVLRAMAAAPLWATLFCVGSSFVMLALQSLRWHRVMGPLLDLRYADAFRAQIVGFLFNALLPARGGDLLRVQYLGRRTGKSRATILGTELVDRWLDFWGWIPTFLVFALVSNPPSWLYKALAVFGALLTAWVTAMIVLTRVGWTPREETLIGRLLGKLFAALRAGMLAFRDRRIWVTAFVIAPLPWLWEACALTIAGHAFGCDLSLVQAFSVMIAFNLATIVPSPGGVGTIESGGLLALDFFGINHASAAAFITVYHFSQLIPGIIGGAAVLLFEGEHLFGSPSGSRKATSGSEADALLAEDVPSPATALAE